MMMMRCIRSVRLSMRWIWGYSALGIAHPCCKLRRAECRESRAGQAELRDLESRLAGSSRRYSSLTRFMIATNNHTLPFALP
jgi:hypothetical protein